MPAQGYTLKAVAEAYSELRREDTLTATRGLSTERGKSWPQAKAFAAGLASSLACRCCEAVAGTLARRLWRCVADPVGLLSPRCEVDDRAAQSCAAKYRSPWRLGTSSLAPGASRPRPACHPARSTQAQSCRDACPATGRASQATRLSTPRGSVKAMTSSVRSLSSASGTTACRAPPWSGGALAGLSPQPRLRAGALSKPPEPLSPVRGHTPTHAGL